MDYRHLDDEGKHAFEPRSIQRPKPLPQDMVGQQRYDRLLERGYAMNKDRDLQKLTRQHGATVRQQVRDALTPEQQIARLDAKLGVGVGAVRERARLADEIAAKAVNETTVALTAEQGKKRKKKASKKR